MNTFEKVVHKAIHKQALNSAVRDLSADDLIVVKRNPNLIDAEVLDKIKDEIDKELLSFAKDVEDMGDSARKIRVSLGIVREIIDQYREGSE